MIEGLSHITLIVQDLERMAHFLKHIFEAEEVYSSGDQTFSVSREKFFLISDVWIAIMEGDPLLSRTYNHIAFKVSDAEFDRYVDRVHALNIDLREGRSRFAEEGRSLYFYDYDNHLFELHTGTLEQRLAFYRRSE
ncbi:phosphonate metabolism protein PhnM (plasmid) [Leptolyngbya boryana NIES-2135]|jgi:catechol 2,3-dioxygenase-like lactoylglutathione lyase family enzyme|uniref:Phosphonate metabolism protein PhnM n=1 Tax=Leptolyngbya boryana NIES-2135 TaxID=1973484 RepID=A0A1Z4JRT9_LEPBY|nr:MULTISPECIES: FosX/FosE/FosI family fosfomycin resistance hydrolase [Leptolyngbya]BAY59481.1 phosphonate metabolism protein PhnM [Leptolyngbya boryana NIES-2135]MBD2373063.1 FosX/FosE/FosI family fosfomycin resistance thiol transferase [Leptolyngbya sp. FACHB-238]MBD2397182.1 FosX/FosE/FosI family fosfomycin resistance thiol transferase [Leptolyngbya sp. FACHB-239]MBD2404012.1 FosX/FosE/FosI family fosfomycin resistance thiol transferase [Leptolyngbya sp. FACHB-402]ULP33305.1 FosX/FosE/FosI